VDNLGGVDVFESSEELVEEKLIVLLCERLIALYNLSEVGVHHLGNHITKCYRSYTSSNSSLDLGRMIVSILMMFSCFNSFSNRSSLRVLFAKILCSKALSIFLMATRSLPSVLDSLSLAATTIP